LLVFGFGLVVTRLEIKCASLKETTAPGRDLASPAALVRGRYLAGGNSAATVTVPVFVGIAGVKAVTFRETRLARETGFLFSLKFFLARYRLFSCFMGKNLRRAMLHLFRDRPGFYRDV
jgi:hypothetical protein